MKGLYFYKLMSPYPEDVTKNCRLTVNEIDSNFLNLKDEDIQSAEFDCEANVITLTRNNGEKLQADLSCAMSGVTKNFDVTFEEEGDCTGTGVLKFSWDEDGNTYESKIEGIVTKDNVGNYVMTEAITDGTIIGNGRDGSPLGLNPVEQTGHYKPVIDLFDVTEGGELPEKDKVNIGDRYLTLEKVDDYGYLYNRKGVDEIIEKLNNGWRVPTKEDWDNLLNAIEPCAYRNHNSSDCHIELGKLAGKELKTKEEWPFDNATSAITDDTAYLFDEIVPANKPINSKGTNKYNFSVLPSGYAYEKNDEIKKFGEVAKYWTNSQTMPTAQSDYYTKAFMYNLSGVWQEADCPYNFYSVRLIKDYTGSNARETAYIGGRHYEEILMPALNSEHGFALWTKTNVDIEVSEDNMIKYSDAYQTKSHKVYVINEWTGKEWERKILPEGGVVVINKQQDCDHEIDTEYRLVDGKLVATDDIVYMRALLKLTPLINELIGNVDGEKEEREESDRVLSGAITTEIERAKAEEARIEEELQDAILDESIKREEEDEKIESKITAESNTRKEADDALGESLNVEIERAKAEEVRLNELIEVLSGSIETESESASTIEAALSGAITTEIERAKAEEARIEGLVPVGAEYEIKANLDGFEDIKENRTASKIEIPSFSGTNNTVIVIDYDFGEITK